MTLIKAWHARGMSITHVYHLRTHWKALVESSADRSSSHNTSESNSELRLSDQDLTSFT